MHHYTGVNKVYDKEMSQFVHFFHNNFNDTTIIHEYNDTR